MGEREREREEKMEIASMSNAFIIVTFRRNRRGLMYKIIINRKSDGESRVREMM